MLVAVKIPHEAVCLVEIGTAQHRRFVAEPDYEILHALSKNDVPLAAKLWAACALDWSGPTVLSKEGKELAETRALIAAYDAIEREGLV